ncbi:MAG: tetratricopeptide repeat protein [Bacteroidota bacterium]
MSDIASRNKAIKQLLTDYPEYPMAYYAWGQAHFKARNYDSAAVYFQKAIDFPASKPGYHVALANCYKNKNDWEKALAQYQIALDIDPDYYPAILERAQYYLESKQADELNEAIETLLGWEKEMAMLYFIRGTQRMNMGDLSGMQKDMKRVIQLNDDEKQMEVYDRLAIWTEEQGMLNYPEERFEWEETNRAYEQMATMMAVLPTGVTNQIEERLKEDFGPYNESLSGEKVSLQEINRITQAGRNQFKAGNFDKALLAFEEVLKYYPQHKEALKYQKEIKALLDK